MAFALYLAASTALLAVWHRFVRRMSLRAALVLLLLPLCFTGRAILTGRIYAPVDSPNTYRPLRDYAKEHGFTPPDHNAGLSDIHTQIIPWQSAVRQAWRRGQWPLWNPYQLCGTPLAGSMQSAPYDPVQILGMVLDHPDALTFGAALTLLLAVLFAFGFARFLGCDELAALVGAAGYAFNGILAFFLQWPLGRVWVYLPLVFMLTSLLIRRARVNDAVALGTTLVVVILTGHPESVVHIVLCGAAWGLFELVRNRQNAKRAIALAVCAGASALVLTAFSILPFLEAVSQTREYLIRKDFARDALDIPAQRVKLRVMSAFYPFTGGRPQRSMWTKLWDPTNLRVGGIVLALAIVALARVRRREVVFFAIFGGVTALAGLDAWPVAQLLHRLPLLDTALNERLAFAAAFSLSMLAAMAIDAWPRDARGRGRIAVLVGICAAALTAGGLIVGPGQIAAGVRAELVFHLLAIESLTLAAAAFIALLPRRIALPLLFTLVVAQRTAVEGDVYPTLDKALFYPDTPVLAKIRSDSGGPFRIAALYESFLPDSAALYGMEDVRGVEAMSFRRLKETRPLWSSDDWHISWFNGIADKNQPFLSLMNVRYLIAPRTEKADEQWTLVMEDRDTRLFRNRRELPRAFVPSRIQYVPNELHEMRGLFSITDFRAVATILVPEYSLHAMANGPGALTIISGRGGEFLFDAVMQRDGWVVTSIPAWKGWRTYIDGRRVETRFANHAFVGVYVPAGRHRVQMTYVPESFTRGRNLSLAGLGILALILGFWKWKSRPGRGIAHAGEKPVAVSVRE